jgi:elongation factor P
MSKLLTYNQIIKNKIIILNEEPYEVLDSRVFSKQQRKPVNQTKLRHLITGKVTEQTFQVSDKAEEASLEKRDVKYIYNRNGEWWFSEISDPSKRFPLTQDTVGDGSKFMKENEVVEAVVFNDEIIGINLPIKVVREVTEAPPNVKGNTAQGGNKVVVLETGAAVTTPMFVEVGDKIEINTQTGEYTGRVS